MKNKIHWFLFNFKELFNLKLLILILSFSILRMPVSLGADDFSETLDHSAQQLGDFGSSTLNDLEKVSRSAGSAVGNALKNSLNDINNGLADTSNEISEGMSDTLSSLTEGISLDDNPARTDQKQPPAQIMRITSADPDGDEDDDDGDYGDDLYDKGFENRNQMATAQNSAYLKTKQNQPNNKKPSVCDHKKNGTIGIASWYGGKEFKNHPTASGERFNENSFTAAMRYAALGSTACVCRDSADGVYHVEVKINDRGPFTGGRLIDLSKGAMIELVGMSPKRKPWIGTGRVRVISGSCTGNRSAQSKQNI